MIQQAAIHPSAQIAPGAIIGEGTTIGAFAVIGPHVTIGARCVIASHVVIDGWTTIGDENRIYPFASVGGWPQDLKYKGEQTELHIGNQNSIREYVTMHPGTSSRLTTVGDGNLFMASSHVAHDCRVGNRNVFANGVMLAGHVEVGSGAILGGGVGVHQFARIGDLAFLGGGSMVSKDVPPFAMAQGDRARLRGLNIIGLKRSGYTSSDLVDLKRAYRLLFYKGGTVDERLARTAEFNHPGVKRLTDFVAASKRGFIMPKHAGGEDDQDIG